MSMFRRRALVLLTLATCIGFASVARADDEDEESVKVFKLLRPQTVSISNAEGSGTGVIVSDDGTILTAAHVVTSPMSYEVKVDVGTDEPKEMTYKKVQIVGFHPDRDLALIKIDPSEHADVKLLPCAISKDKPTQGARIYAVGDPGAGDKVMTKSITQGIVSGVDRDFDGLKFYQIDAGINPGNSGGPVVNKKGLVIGIVSFKFQQLQVMNFAVPVRDVDFKAFVPLIDHKANPQRAAELLKMARMFAEQAERAKAGGGDDGMMRRYYARYAAQCYEEALIYDPSNPDIYDNIGSQYVDNDMPEQAQAYLVRAIQLRPWGPLSGNPYRMLGRAWKQQRNDDNKIFAAWKEGLAKFPYSANLWDDLASFQMEKEQYADAAYSASVALACGPTNKKRVGTLQRIIRDCRGKMDDDAQADFKKKTTHDTIVATLEKARVKSNAARKRKSMYMTEAFGDIIKEIGTLDVPGIEDKILQVPLKAPAKLSADPDADDGATTDTKSDDDKTAKPPSADEKPKKKDAAADEDMTDDETPDETPKPKAKAHKAAAGDDEDTSGSNDKPNKHAATNDTPKAAAGEDWIGPKKKAKPDGKGDGKGDDATSTDPTPGGPTIIVPRPAVTGMALAGAVTTIDDAKVVPLDVDNEAVYDAALSADGKWMYVLHADGLLRKVSVPGMKEDRQIDLKTDTAGFGMTKNGIAVVVKSAKELWLLDPTTLTVKHRIPVGDVKRMATARDLSAVLVSTGTEDLSLIDPVTEKVSATFTPAELTATDDGHLPKVDFSLFAFTPDGQYLFVKGTDTKGDSLVKFKLSNNKLTFEAAGPKIGEMATNICVSPDSRYVSMPCKTGNKVPDGENKPGMTCVFKVSDLKTPVISIATGGASSEFAFDTVAKQIYANSADAQLIVFSPQGDKIKDYTLAHGATVKRFLALPAGHSIVVVSGSTLNLVTVP